ncbi:MAG: hypothetical protein ABI609_07110 [Acidobacteriota bacterium]
MDVSEPVRSLAWEFQMKDQIARYFQAEKFESALFVLAAAAAIAISILLINSASEYRWIAVPLIAIALIQIVVGGTVLARTNRQVDRLTNQLDTDPLDYRAQELQRMDRVQRNFKLYEAIEITLLLGGIALSYFMRSRIDWYAVGIGFIAQSALMLVFDLVAAHRAEVYVDHIRRLVSAA